MNERQFVVIFILGAFYTFVLGVSLYFVAQWAHRKRWWAGFWAAFVPAALLWTYHIGLSIDRLLTRPPPGWHPDRPPGWVARIDVTQIGLWGTFYLISGVVPLLIGLWWNPFRRHWPRFNLRQMFYFVAVVSACVAGITWANTYGPHGTHRGDYWYRRGFQIERYSDGSLRSLEYTGIYRGMRVSFDRSLMPLIGDLRSLRKVRLEGVANLNLTVDITDEDLANLRSLIHLEELTVNSAYITDRSIATFMSFPKLRMLYINDTSVTEATAEALLQIPELKSVGYAPGWSQEARSRVAKYCASNRARDRE